MGINPVDLLINPVYHNITGYEPKLPTHDEPSLLSKVFHDPRNNYVSPDDEHFLLQRNTVLMYSMHGCIHGRVRCARNAKNRSRNVEIERTQNLCRLVANKTAVKLLWRMRCHRHPGWPRELHIQAEARHRRVSASHGTEDEDVSF